MASDLARVTVSHFGGGDKDLNLKSVSAASIDRSSTCNRLSTCSCRRGTAKTSTSPVRQRGGQHRLASHVCHLS